MNRRPIVTFSTHALVEVLRALQPDFEAEQDCRLAFAFDPSQALRRRVAEGEAFDIVVGTREMIDALAAEGWVAPETRATIGRTGLGISVRAGAARPDLGSVAAFKRALLTAKSVVRSREGASGSAFADVLERLGIADAMRDKVIVAGSGRVAEYAARGEAEMAVQQISELVPVQGADFVGPFPPELQRETVFAAAVSSASEARAAAEAFVALLTAPASAPVFRANGLAPAG